jgi:hypothetical protein
MSYGIGNREWAFFFWRVSLRGIWRRQNRQYHVDDSDRYFVLVPDVNPFESLRSSLISGGFSQSETKTLLGRRPEALATLIQRLKRSEDKWLLFIDQFEGNLYADRGVASREVHRRP